MPVSTVFTPVVRSAPSSACESIWVPLAGADVERRLAAVPTQFFFSSIEPCLRVLVKVQTTV